ncbi:MAG: DUF4399 domain-containing protein [Rhodobacteraceae bacterium]|nr:MAG: DUF4399 domain-containing protein [Paracoccaceae bacterium]
MLRLTSATAGLVMLALAGPGFGQSHSHDDNGMARTPAPDGAMVYFVGLEDGATVSNPVTLHFGARGIGIAPAGVEWPNTGHHHLLINIDPDTVDMEFGLPADDQHIHFGGGQTEVTLELPEGTHSMFLLMGDQNHVPHDPPIMSTPITITVE